MSKEDSFKKLISGEVTGPIGSIARGGLSLLSKVYEQGVEIRNLKFDKGEMVTTVAAPVISVGNLTAGGTGKTPMVRYICEFLAANSYKPAILSRGYKAKDTTDSIVVSKEGKLLVDATVSGDEAWLLARSLPTVSVVIGRKRVISAELAISTLGSDVLILDDGFQHRSLGRDFDVVLIDATNPFGYEHVIPRGLLREPIKGLQRADCIVLTKSNHVSTVEVRKLKERIRSLVPNVPIVETIHAPMTLTALNAWREGHIISCLDEQNKGYKDMNFLAVSGIGNPQSFMNTITEAGLHAIAHYAFGDHHQYSDDDVITIWKEAFAKGANGIIITEKDAVKLSQLSSMADLKMPVLVLGIGILFTEGEVLFTSLLEKTIKKGC